MYDVLKQSQVPTGEKFTHIDRKTGRCVTGEWFSARFELLGKARDMKEAKEKFGGAPVLAVPGEW
jgi:hypothetical protein